MNVALSSRHAVHLSHEGSGPRCYAFGAPHGSEAYRPTTREVTCKNCLKLRSDAHVEPVRTEAEAAEATQVPAVWSVQQGRQLMWTPDGKNLYSSKGRAQMAAKYLAAQSVDRPDDSRVRLVKVGNDWKWTPDGISFYTTVEQAIRHLSPVRKVRRERLNRQFPRRLLA